MSGRARIILGALAVAAASIIAGVVEDERALRRAIRTR